MARLWSIQTTIFASKALQKRENARELLPGHLPHETRKRFWRNAQYALPTYEQPDVLPQFMHL